MDDNTMVISISAEAVERRTLIQSIHALQWRVTTLDEEIEATRQSLLIFEASYQEIMAPISDKHAQLDKVLRRLKAPRTIKHQPLCRNDRRSTTPTRNVRRDPPVTPTKEASTEIPHIRDLFRSLARQHHPDLAINEDDRIMRSHVMSLINDAYKQKDLTRLLQIQDRMVAVNIDEDLHHLRNRHAHLTHVETQLLQEMETLRQCPIAQLHDTITEASQRGLNLLPLIQEDMEKEFIERLSLIRSAAYDLEQTATTEHHSNASPTTPKSYINHRILDKIIALANTSPNTVFLLLISHFFNENPDAISGLSHYDDIDMRLRALSTSRTSLAACLVDAESWVSFDVIKHHRNRTGIMIRDPVIAATMPHFIAHPDSSSTVRRVLSVIGDIHRCTRCKRDVFTIPLLLLHGLDSLRALACSLCGHWVHMYWLPCGDDIASQLGSMYLEHELSYEIKTVLGDTKVGIQLAPSQYARWTVDQLIDVVVHHVFFRNNIVLNKDDVLIMHDNKVIQKNIPIKNLHDLELMFTTMHGKNINTSMQEVIENIAFRYTLRE